MKQEYIISKELETAANSIKDAVMNGNIVWITTASGETVLLDDECQIGFMSHK